MLYVRIVWVEHDGRANADLQVLLESQVNVTEVSFFDLSDERAISREAGQHEILKTEQWGRRG